MVGDLAALEAKVTGRRRRRAGQALERGRGAPRRPRGGRVQREALVAEAESIAAQPENKVQWKASGARMRALLDEWKALQRSGPKLDRESETALWQRFSAARNGFDKARRVHFAQLEGTQSEAKAAKQKLVAEAEELATSTDWAPTATAFKRLMDRWREAGRASPHRRRRAVGPVQGRPGRLLRRQGRGRRGRGRGVPGQPRGQGGAAGARPRRSCRSPTSRPPRRRCARSRTTWDAAGKVPARRPRADREGHAPGRADRP